jgi:hypothetical protein
MIPYYRKVQDAGRSLVVRGAFEPDELQFLMDMLDPRGLLLLIMVKDISEIETARPIVGM